jgi:hypothetical protein
MASFYRRLTVSSTILEWQDLARRARMRRIRNALEIDAAIIIQRNCHRWLWAPVCRDGSMGLMVKKNMTEAMSILR